MGDIICLLIYIFIYFLIISNRTLNTHKKKKTQNDEPQ